MTSGAALRMAAKALANVSDAPPLEAARMLEHVLARGRAWLVAHADESLDDADLTRLNALLARRRTGEPLAYVLGSGWFYGRAFDVDPSVLVPRPETEHVVEAALDELRARSGRAGARLRACDVGTGSGAIGVTLAAEMPALEVYLSDASEAALAVARRNAERLGVAAQVRCVSGDLAAPLLAFGPYDCVVANLPYVPTGDVPAAPDPVGFEPRLAVDGGADGLALYRRLVADLPRMLAPGACAFLEAAPATIEGLATLAAALPGAHVEIGEDYAGLERFVSLGFDSEGGRNGTANGDIPI